MIEKSHFQCNDFMLIHHKLKLAENSIVEWWQMPLILFSPFHLTGSQLCNHFKTYRSIRYLHFKFRIAIEYSIPFRFISTMNIMAIWVVKFQSDGYKIRYVFGQKSTKQFDSSLFFLKVRKSRNDFFKPKEKGMKKFYFTTMKPQVDFFPLLFGGNWRHQKDISKLTDL